MAHFQMNFQECTKEKGAEFSSDGKHLLYIFHQEFGRG